MENEKITISSPVKVVSDSPQRVAFDLMIQISSACYTADQEAQKTKDYWLALYHQCWQATHGSSLKSIHKDG